MAGAEGETLATILGLTKHINERTKRHSKILEAHSETLTQHGEALATLSERTKTHRTRINHLDRRVWSYLLIGGGGLAGAIAAGIAAWSKFNGGGP